MSALMEHADKIRAQVDIAEVVGRHVELRRGGINLKGICPFHSEKTPSFTVSPSKGIFHCFGCGEGGDVVKFVQKIERLEWVEALRLLSEQYGLPMPQRERPENTEARDHAREERERLLEVSKLATQFFAGHMVRTMEEADSEVARYLARRRIDAEAVRQFELGLAPDAWQDLTDAAKRADYDADTVVMAGLAIRNQEKKRIYDRFRNRLMFPIHDNVGRPIAFGGRVYRSDASPDEPKYVNSPETPLYRKGQQLYALHLAKDSIVRARRALVMEGYMDVIRAHRSGFTEAVATCGTALTDEQAKGLRRYAEEVVFVYDGDDAGQKAMLRGTEVLLDHGFAVRVVSLPDDHDPDSFLLEVGAEAFGKAVTSAVPFLDFFLDGAMKRYGTSTPDAKVRVIEELLPLLRRVRNPIAASEYARRTADFLDVDAALVISQLNKAPTTSGPQLVEQITAVRSPQELPPLRDRMLLRLLVESPLARAQIFEQVDPSWLGHDRVRWVYEHLRIAPETVTISYDYLHARAESEEDSALLRAISLEDEPIDDSERTISNVIARLRRHFIGLETDRLRRQLSRTPTTPHQEDEHGEIIKDSNPLVQQIDQITRALPTVGRDYFLKPGKPTNGQTK